MSKKNLINKIKRLLQDFGIYLGLVLFFAIVFLGIPRLYKGYWFWEGLNTPKVIVEKAFSVDERPEEEWYRITIRYRNLVYKDLGTISELEARKCIMEKEIIHDYNEQIRLEKLSKTNEQRAKALETSNCN